jgi:hypothetical protein
VTIRGPSSTPNDQNCIFCWGAKPRKAGKLGNNAQTWLCQESMEIMPNPSEAGKIIREFRYVVHIFHIMSRNNIKNIKESFFY